jgi:hypothetical protein
MTIAESVWETYKRLRLIALDRFFQRVLDECQAICTNRSLTAHERYGELYGLLQERDEEMAHAFDDFRRSTAIWRLRVMVFHGLLTKKELSEFSSEVQSVVCAE